MADAVRSEPGATTRPYGLSPTVADAVLGAVVAGALLVTAFAGVAPATPPPSGPQAVGAVAVAAVVAAAIRLRRRHPVAVLLVLDATLLTWFAAGLPGLLIALGPLIGCYTLAVRRGWRWALAGAVCTAPVLIVGVRVVLGDADTAGVVPMAVLLVATASSAGAAVGYYRAMLGLTRAQLARETRTRDEVARRLVAEERLRIARELHDVVGHALATVSVQAGVGLHVLEQRPDQAREALAAIKALCDDGLTDVKAAIGILRADTTPDATGDPGSGLDRLPDLVAAAENAGLTVEPVLTGLPRQIPAPVDRAAYRIVQEALTNVLRHSTARRVRVELCHDPARLLVTVRDDGARTTVTGRGHGIDGMRERAHALSGSLAAAPHPDGGFEVRAELPLPDAG
jgi:signal transduction histidine kinase